MKITVQKLRKKQIFQICSPLTNLENLPPKLAETANFQMVIRRFAALANLRTCPLKINDLAIANLPTENLAEIWFRRPISNSFQYLTFYSQMSLRIPPSYGGGKSPHKAGGFPFPPGGGFASRVSMGGDSLFRCARPP
jgi:hypothetical protein